VKCCGKAGSGPAEPAAWRSSSAPGHTTAPPAIEITYVTFEYLGRTRLSIRGPLTGARYDFPHAGALVEIDRRDATYFTGLPQLRVRPVPTPP
jgi:hypothetical protein